jgi:hypothetical protein
MPPHQLLTSRFDPRWFRIEPRADRHCRALHANDAGAFEDALLVETEALDLFFSISCRMLSGTRALDIREAARQPPAPVALGHDPFVLQIVHDVEHEERVALGAPVNEARQQRWNSCSGIAMTDIAQRSARSGIRVAARDKAHGPAARV